MFPALVARGHRLGLTAIAAVLLVYTLVLVVMPKHVFWSPDEGGKFIMARSVSWDNGLRFSVPYPGAKLDPSFVFYPSPNPYPYVTNNYPFPQADGTIQYPWSPLFPFLTSIPFYLFGITGVYMIPLVSGWLTAVVAWWLVHKSNPRLAWLTVLLTAFGSPIFFYSVTLWEHTLVTLLAMIALGLMTRRSLSWMSALLLTMPLLLVMIILRLEMIAFACAVLLGWMLTQIMLRPNESSPSDVRTASVPRSWAKRIGYTALVALGLIFILSLPNLITFRHQRDIATYIEVAQYYGSRLFSSSDSFLHYFLNLPNIIVNFAGTDGPTIDGIWLWATCIAIALCMGMAWVRNVRMEAILLIPSLLVILIPSLIALFTTQDYRSLHGIFLITPYAVMFPYALTFAWRKRDSLFFFLALVAFIYLVLGIVMLLMSKVNHLGTLTTGLEWGPRYVLALYPILAMLIPYAVSHYRASDRPAWLKRFVAIMVALMILMGVYLQFRGLAMLYTGKQTIVQWQNALESQTRLPIVTDFWWLPASVATSFVENEMYVVHPQNAPEWFDLAAAKGIDKFIYISQQRFDQNMAGSAAVQLVEEDWQLVGGMYVTRLRLIGKSEHR